MNQSPRVQAQGECETGNAFRYRYLTAHHLRKRVNSTYVVAGLFRNMNEVSRPFVWAMKSAKVSSVAVNVMK